MPRGENYAMRTCTEVTGHHWVDLYEAIPDEAAAAAFREACVQVNEAEVQAQRDIYGEDWWSAPPQDVAESDPDLAREYHRLLTEARVHLPHRETMADLRAKVAELEADLAAAQAEPRGETAPQSYEDGMRASAMGATHECSRGHEHEGWANNCSECELGCRRCSAE